MSGVSRILADTREVSECQLDPLSSRSEGCVATCSSPVTKRSSAPPAPTFAAPPASFAIQKAEEAVKSFLQSQTVLSTVVIPLGPKSRNRRKGAAPKRAASEDDVVPARPVERKQQKPVGTVKRKGVSKGGKRQGAKRNGMSAEEALLEMERRMANRAKKSTASSSSRKSPAFYRSFPLVFGHNCMQCTA